MRDHRVQRLRDLMDAAPYGVQGRLAAWAPPSHITPPILARRADSHAGCAVAAGSGRTATAPRPRRGKGPPRRRAVALTFPVLSPRAAKPLRSRRIGAIAAHRVGEKLAHRSPRM